MKSRIALHRLATRLALHGADGCVCPIISRSASVQQLRTVTYDRKATGKSFGAGRVTQANRPPKVSLSSAVLLDTLEASDWENESQTTIEAATTTTTTNETLATTNNVLTRVSPSSSIKHCETCSCDDQQHDHEPRTQSHNHTTIQASHDHHHHDGPFPCGNPHHEDDSGALPPPLPEPVYSVHKRILPSSLTALSSPTGRKLLLETITNETAASYWSLTEQFENQSDPAFCGVTTLQMALNAMGIDPKVRWRGGWRFYGSEEVLLHRCCLSVERIRRVGVTLDEFRLLARCHGLSVELNRPEATQQQEQEQIGDLSAHVGSRQEEGKTIDDLRNDLRRVLAQSSSSSQLDNPSSSKTLDNSILAVSFSRASLGQTGSGHFSPLAAYHEPTDQVLCLDVARFKYAPYWVSVSDLYRAMQENDSVTKKPRGWFVLTPPKSSSSHVHYSSQQQPEQEERIPAEYVPLVGDAEKCPIGTVKIDFCAANRSNKKD